MTHIEVIVVPDDPTDEDPRSDGGLTAAASARLAGALGTAGFRIVNGPAARPPATVHGGWRAAHEHKARP